MDLNTFKKGLLEKTALNEEMIKEFGDGNLELLLPIFDNYLANNKEETGYIALALFIGLKLNGFNMEQIQNVFKEANNSKKEIDSDDADWLLTRAKLGI